MVVGSWASVVVGSWALCSEKKACIYRHHYNPHHNSHKHGQPVPVRFFRRRRGRVPLVHSVSAQAYMIVTHA